ncbi:transglycosylase SLT domain-containing protein [Streptomyces sp. NPDC017991]|uniref:transglycosylase SLT domain-containing protein n=1 Tax=Streptomyces sp. NPDC017991 TaxID=3365026 RepID=UPI0037A427C6
MAAGHSDNPPQGSGSGQSSFGVIVAIALGGMGLTGFLGLVTLICVLGLVVICAIGVLMWPAVLICHIFGCGEGGSAQIDQDQVVSAYHSDGSGTLEDASVPADLLETVKAAGDLCTQIGPIVIAAQIQQESTWTKDLTGPDGAEGISQLPPDKFDEFGEDDDDNGTTSALDAEDSIMAQGRYLCSLAGDVETLLADNEVEGDALDLTLASYDVGLEAVKEARGVPTTSRSQSYVSGVRSQFSLYSGAIKPPEGSAYPTISAVPTSTQ